MMSKVRKQQKQMKEAFDKICIGEFESDLNEADKKESNFRANIDELDQIFAFLTDIME